MDRHVAMETLGCGSQSQFVSQQDFFLALALSLN